MRHWNRISLTTIIALGCVATMVTAQTNEFNEEREHHDRVEGGWYITAQLTDPIRVTFDATYAFAKGGAFTRIAGTDNAPAVGTWKYTDDGGIVFSSILFNFVNGVRTGAILGKFSSHIVDGTLTGTFAADGILGLTNFHRSGTFTGIRIVPEAP